MNQHEILSQLFSGKKLCYADSPTNYFYWDSDSRKIQNQNLEEIEIDFNQQVELYSGDTVKFQNMKHNVLYKSTLPYCSELRYLKVGDTLLRLNVIDNRLNKSVLSLSSASFKETKDKIRWIPEDTST